jgi:hypothetical protein
MSFDKQICRNLVADECNVIVDHNISQNYRNKWNRPSPINIQDLSSPDSIKFKY